MNKNVLPVSLSSEKPEFQNRLAISSSDDSSRSVQEPEKVCLSMLNTDQRTAIPEDVSVRDLVQQAVNNPHHGNIFQRIADLEARISNLESRYETVSDRMDTNEQLLDRHEERLHKITDTVTVLSDGNGIYPQVVEQVKQEMSQWWHHEVFPDILEMHDEYDSVLRDIDDVGSRIDDLEACLDVASGRMDTIEERYEVQNKDQEKRMNSLTESISFLDDEYKEQYNIVAGLDHITYRMQFKLEHLEPEVRDNSSNIIELERKLDRIVDDEKANEIVSMVTKGLRSAENVMRFERRMNEFWPVINEMMRQMSSVSDKARNWLENSRF